MSQLCLFIGLITYFVEVLNNGLFRLLYDVAVYLEQVIKSVLHAHIDVLLELQVLAEFLLLTLPHNNFLQLIYFFIKLILVIGIFMTIISNKLHIQRYDFFLVIPDHFLQDFLLLDLIGNYDSYLPIVEYSL